MTSFLSGWVLFQPGRRRSKRHNWQQEWNSFLDLTLTSLYSTYSTHLLIFLSCRQSRTTDLLSYLQRCKCVTRFFIWSHQWNKIHAWLKSTIHHPLITNPTGHLSKKQKYIFDPSFNLRGLNEIKAGYCVNILERVGKRNCTLLWAESFPVGLVHCNICSWWEKQPLGDNRIKSSERMHFEATHF